ncbi:hypothetical protein GCM10027276_44320 [Comamonas piscis]
MVAGVRPVPCETYRLPSQLRADADKDAPMPKVATTSDTMVRAKWRFGDLPIANDFGPISHTPFKEISEKLAPPAIHWQR